MEENQYKSYLTRICFMVNRTYNFSVSVSNIEYIGIHKYSDEKVYKVELETPKTIIEFYVEEDAFERWGEVPWSGLHAFRPADWNDWPEDKKLMTAWCWAVYKYCSNYGIHGYTEHSPEILE